MLHQNRHIKMAIQMLAVLYFATLFCSVTAEGAQQRKAELLEKIKQSPSMPTRLDNSPSCPLLIESSTSKEISNAEYSKLVGINTTSERVSSFPDVRLFNNSSKPVTGFILLLKHEQTKITRFIKVNRVSIQPYSNYIIEAIRWLRWEKQSQPPSGLESEKMWLIGRAQDYAVIVAAVDFEDGSKWIVKDEAATPTGYNVKVSQVSFSNMFRTATYLRPARYRFSCTCSCGAHCWAMEQ